MEKNEDQDIHLSPSHSLIPSLATHPIHHHSDMAGSWWLATGHCRPVRHMRPALPLHLPAPGPAEERDGDERENDDEEGDLESRRNLYGGEELNLMIQKIMMQDS